MARLLRQKSKWVSVTADPSAHDLSSSSNWTAPSRLPATVAMRAVISPAAAAPQRAARALAARLNTSEPIAVAVRANSMGTARLKAVAMGMAVIRKGADRMKYPQ